MISATILTFGGMGSSGSSFHSIHRIAARRGIELGAPITVGELVDRARKVRFAPPGYGLEGSVCPIGGDQSSVPVVAAVVEHVDQSGVISVACALHDVEIIIHI